MTLFSLKFNILIGCILCLVGILTDSSKASKLEKPDRLGHCIFFFSIPLYAFICKIWLIFHLEKFWQHTCSIIMVNMLPTNLGCFYWWNRFPESSGIYKPLLSTHICIGRSARVTYGVPISLDSISFFATADCGVSTLGYSLSYVYATHHILKRLNGSGFCMRYLGRFGEKVLQVSQFPSGHVYGLQIPPSTWKYKRAHYCFFFFF